MKLKNLDRKKKMKEWIVAGPYAVLVEIEAVYPEEDPSEPCFTPETVRFLERIEALAEARDLKSLEKLGKVYVRLKA